MYSKVIDIESVLSENFSQDKTVTNKFGNRSFTMTCELKILHEFSGFDNDQLVLLNWKIVVVANISPAS